MVGAGILAGLVAIFGEACFQNHTWPMTLSCAVGATVIYKTASWRERTYGIRDSVYYIPMGIWAALVMVIGLCCLLVPTSPKTANNPQDANPIPVNARQTGPNGPFYKTAKPLPPGTLQLQGIIYNQTGTSTAIINNTSVSVGDNVAGYRVRNIQSRSVTLVSPNGTEKILTVADTGP